MSHKEKYLFGPVPSRRLGLSLGVDIVPLKTCTQNCLYCQLGMDAPQSLERREYVPLQDVLTEIQRRLQAGLKADYITISGSGEPTLNSGLGWLIDRIHENTTIPVAVITNGSLLWRTDVQNDCIKADVVLPSLDAGDNETFQKLNHPHPEIDFSRFAEGLIAFRNIYKGQIWLEVFICEDINTSDAALRNIGHIIDQIKPNKVQLNTAVRPTAHPEIRAVSPQRMAEIAQLIGRNAEVIADFPKDKTGSAECTPESVMETLVRRPCTVEGLASSLGADKKAVLYAIKRLLDAGCITSDERDGLVYYKPSPQ
ncbi:MAG TPA: radical SAM protein [Anaerohalosphaeraceae bacterium]|nr:radical SAM protein [Anaerohalosphaeraceae bacterium]